MNSSKRFPLGVNVPARLISYWHWFPLMIHWLPAGVSLPAVGSWVLSRVYLGSYIYIVYNRPWNLLILNTAGMVPLLAKIILQAKILCCRRAPSAGGRDSCPPSTLRGWDFSLGGIFPT